MVVNTDLIWTALPTWFIKRGLPPWQFIRNLINEFKEISFGRSSKWKWEAQIFAREGHQLAGQYTLCSLDALNIALEESHCTLTDIGGQTWGCTPKTLRSSLTIFSSSIPGRRNRTISSRWRDIRYTCSLLRRDCKSQSSFALVINESTKLQRNI